MDEVIEILGLSAYIALFLALLSGVLIFTRKAKWLKLKWHMWLGIAAFVLSSLHVIIVLTNR